MKKRTLLDIDEEIDDIELQILSIKESMSQDEPDWREPHRRQTRDLPIGYVPLVDRRQKVELLKARVDRLKNERHALIVSQGSRSGAKMAHGELKKTIAGLAKRDGCKPGDTVPSTKINSWVREIQLGGKSTTAASIRSQLTNLSITKERVKKKK